MNQKVINIYGFSSMASKEQFSDGVGYNWVDSLIEEAEKQIEHFDLEEVQRYYPVNTPTTKEGLLYRRI